MTAVTELEDRLDALEAAGARSFDAAACDAVRRLLDAAKELEGAVAERLAGRAVDHLSRLERRLEEHTAKTEARLASLERELGEQPDLRSALDKGETRRVARTARRRRQQPQAALAVRQQRANLATSQGRPRAAAPSYEESMAELVASFALARAVDVVPESAGPYNSLRIATGALRRMRELSPLYLTAQLNRLEELASLMSLPELPAPPPKPKPPPRSKAKAGAGRKRRAAR